MDRPLGRRDFLRNASLTGSALTLIGGETAFAGPTAEAADAATDVPWHQRIRRVGQLNMTEHDVVDMKVEEWGNYSAPAKVDAVLVSVTGILAFYPSKVPFHKPSKFLGNRDFFGECCAAAKKRGIRVVARMSPDLQWQEALDAHPEWFERDAEGRPHLHNEDPRLFRTCMFGNYFTDFMPAIMREVNSLYDVDGLYTNAWPPLGQIGRATSELQSLRHLVCR